MREQQHDRQKGQADASAHHRRPRRTVAHALQRAGMHVVIVRLADVCASTRCEAQADPAAVCVHTHGVSPLRNAEVAAQHASPSCRPMCCSSARNATRRFSSVFASADVNSCLPGSSGSEAAPGTGSAASAARKLTNALYERWTAMRRSGMSVNAGTVTSSAPSSSSGAPSAASGSGSAASAAGVTGAPWSANSDRFVSTFVRAQHRRDSAPDVSELRLRRSQRCYYAGASAARASTRKVADAPGVMEASFTVTYVCAPPSVSCCKENARLQTLRKALHTSNLKAGVSAAPAMLPRPARLARAAWTREGRNTMDADSD